MMLDVKEVHACYGKSHVLQGISLNVNEGETVTLLGRNGAGKSTTLKTIAGVVAQTGGTVTFAGRPVSGQPAHRIAARGLCFVPEHRGIFRLLSVEENLRLGARRDSPWQLDDIYRIFPRLKERRRNGGAQLSGGEQQMLAIGRALMSSPRLLLLDEPSMGLAPQFIRQIFSIITEINKQGTTVLLVEQNANQALARAHRAFVLETGSITRSGTGRELLADPAIKEAYLGVG